MAWNGDHGAYPAEVHTILHATPAMLQEAAVLGSNATVAWFDREVTATKDVVNTLVCKCTSVLAAAVFITDHSPEAYLIRFVHQHHYASIVS